MTEVLIIAQRFLGRRNPSGSRVQYLIHLEDCRRLAFIGLTNALSLLLELSDSIKDDKELDKWLLDYSSEIEQDVRYLQAQLQALQDPIANIQILVKHYFHLMESFYAGD